MAEGVFPTLEKFPTSGIISELGIQFPISGNSSELLPDIGKWFPMSGNSFRYRKTVSDVGKQFPVSGTVLIPELLLHVIFRCRKTISGNGLRCQGTSRSL